MPRPSRSNHRNVRALIRAAAIDLFSSQGFAGTSTRELCEAAGISKPALYHYFPTKEGLFRQIVSEALEGYREGMLRAQALKGTAEQRMVEVVWNDFRFTRQESQLLRLLYRVVFAAEPVIDARGVVNSVREELEVLIRLAQQGMRAGEWVGSPEEIALSVLGLSHIYTLRYFVGGEGGLSRATAQRCVDIALRGCGASPRAPGHTGLVGHPTRPEAWGRSKAKKP